MGKLADEERNGRLETGRTYVRDSVNYMAKILGHWKWIQVVESGSHLKAKTFLVRGYTTGSHLFRRNVPATRTY